MNVGLLVLASAIVLCDAAEKIDKLRCKSVRPCILQLLELNRIAFGQYEPLFNKTRFSGLCEQLDFCTDQSVQNIKSCSEHPEIYTEATVGYMRKVRTYLCSRKGRKRVTKLYNSPCAQKTKTWEEAESAVWECIMKDIKDFEQGRLNPASCRFLPEQKCWISGLRVQCGKAFSKLHSQLNDIILEHLPHCHDWK